MYWPEHILRRIEKADVLSYPYDHLYIQGIFPSSFYKRLLRQRPAEYNYEDKEDYPGRRTSVCRNFTASSSWSELSNFVQCNPFRNMLCEKFGLSKEGRSLHYVHRDLDGFHIKPHTDIPCKRLSYIFYFPEDSSHAHLGTWMCTPKSPMEWSEDHKPWSLFDRVKMAPYLPNSLFVWVVNHDSYHAVDVYFDPGDPVQFRQTLRGFVFRRDMPLPYTFARDFDNVAMPNL